MINRIRNQRSFFVLLSGGANSENLPDSAETTVNSAIFKVPEHWGGAKARALVVPAANGDIYSKITASAGAEGGTSGERTTAGSYAAEATDTTLNNMVSEQVLDVLPGDLVSVSLTRDSNNVLDTINDAATIYGFVIERT